MRSCSCIPFCVAMRSYRQHLVSIQSTFKVPSNAMQGHTYFRHETHTPIPIPKTVTPSLSFNIDSIQNTYYVAQYLVLSTACTPAHGFG